VPAEVQLAGLPAEEAIEHLRTKLRIPTQHWDDLRGEIHAKGFTVAGATKADLLRDLHEAIAGTLAEGGNITDFRRQFDQAVERHGWSYKGKRGWRTRVIYDNNLRTAHMAGRWAQIQRTKERRPYLQYLTVGDSRVRDEHRQWDRLVLPVDDPFWDTHYPPNDYGCRCTVRTLSERDLEREGLAAGSSPTVRRTERVNTRTGEIYGDVPEGLGVGWDYNPGKAWIGQDAAFGQKLMELPRAMRQAALAEPTPPGSAAGFRLWAEQLAGSGDRPAGEARSLSYLRARTLEGMERNGSPTTSALVIARDRELRESVRRHGLAADDLEDLYRNLSAPEAVLRSPSTGELMFVVRAGDKRLVARIETLEALPQNDGRRAFGAHLLERLQDASEIDATWGSRYQLLEGRL